MRSLYEKWMPGRSWKPYYVVTQELIRVHSAVPRATAADIVGLLVRRVHDVTRAIDEAGL